jgi:cytochrome c oxidase subunit 3
VGFDSICTQSGRRIGSSIAPNFPYLFAFGDVGTGGRANRRLSTEATFAVKVSETIARKQRLSPNGGLEMNSPNVVPTELWATVPKSRFCVWLFLSTEVMFFVALIGSYLVMRSAIPESDWPDAAAVGLVPWIGAINTLILLASSVFMTRAAIACGKRDARRAKIALVIAVFLGIAFLSVKSYEYSEKYRLGLFPRLHANLVYPRPDVEYLGAVQSELSQARAQLAESKDLSFAKANESRIALLDTIKSGLVAWTSREVGRSNDPFAREQALAALAFYVRPTRGSADRVKKYLADQKVELSRQRDVLADRKIGIERQLEENTSTLKDLPSSSLSASQKAELEQQTTALRSQLTIVNADLDAAKDRLDWLTLMANKPAGINAEFGLRLPIVVPGGKTWINGYYLLSGLHALHLFAGIVAAAMLIPLVLDARRAMWLGNVAAYWNFVDAVWLVLFPIIYLF